MSTHLEDTVVSEGEKKTLSPAERSIEAWAESTRLWTEGLTQTTSKLAGQYTETMGLVGENLAPGKMIENLGNPAALFESYMRMNQLLAETYVEASVSAMQYAGDQMKRFREAVETGDMEKVALALEEQAEMLRRAVVDKPKMEKNLGAEYGLHFENENEYVKVMETPRATVYRVVSLEKGAEPDPSAAPSLFVSPFILTDAIQGLLPHAGISFVHSFADKGATYIVRFKDVVDTPEVQTMTIEDVLNDVAEFLKKLKEIHGQEVTVVGTCQGAAVSLAGVLSGKWEGLTNALIQVVPPNDLTQSDEWKELQQKMPKGQQDFWDITAVSKAGNRMVSGEAMGLVTRLQAGVSHANPVSDLVDRVSGIQNGVSPRAAATTRWLEDRRYLPLHIAEWSAACAKTPIGSDSEGTMPYEIDGEKVHLSDLPEGFKIYAIGGGRDGVCSPSVVGAPFEHPAWVNNPNVSYRIFKDFGHISEMTSAVVPGKRDKPGGVYADGGAWCVYNVFAHGDVIPRQKKEEKPERNDDYLINA